MRNQPRSAIRWRIRKRTFAHVVTVEAGSRRAFAQIGRNDMDRTIVTFRAPADEVHALSQVGHPYFFAGWGRDVVGLIFDDDTDWSEVGSGTTF